MEIKPPNGQKRNPMKKDSQNERSLEQLHIISHKNKDRFNSEYGRWIVSSSNLPLETAGPGLGLGPV